MHATNLGRYRLLEEIGSGGMGTVYRAEITAPSAELEAGHIVAIKVVHPHLLAQDGYLQRFLREADIGQRIDHPNVVRTYEVARADTDEGMCHFLAMEHVDGQTLRQLLDEMTRVPEALCRHIGREISRALVAIHGAGVVHRDLKPENVLITPQDTVKVMDLGVARLADAAVRISQTGVFLGSLEYAAPEQIRGQEDDLDGRADLHALGVMLYELATAVHPYRADHVPAVMRRILEDLPRRCGEVNPQISAFYEGLVHALLEKNPAERIATAGEVVSILSEGESGPWWVRWAKAERKRTRHPLRQIRLPRETELYGRDGELATLHRLFDEARAGSGRVLLLQGEPGVGKTRLLDEFVAALQGRRRATACSLWRLPAGRCQQCRRCALRGLPGALRHGGARASACVPSRGHAIAGPVVRRPAPGRRPPARYAGADGRVASDPVRAGNAIPRGGATDDPPHRRHPPGHGQQRGATRVPRLRRGGSSDPPRRDPRGGHTRRVAGRAVAEGPRGDAGSATPGREGADAALVRGDRLRAPGP